MFSTVVIPAHCNYFCFLRIQQDESMVFGPWQRCFIGKIFMVHD